MSLIRVTASEATRRARIEAREPEGKWRDWSLARTVELDEALEDGGYEDAVVENDGRELEATVIAVLDAAGW